MNEPATLIPANTVAEESPTCTSQLTRLVILLAVILPFFGFILAIVSFWGWGCNWMIIGLLAVMYVLTGLGITVGYHRLFTHQAFETSRVVKFIFGILGSMAVQGPLLRWVALHRLHHQCSDHDGDPHSPTHHGQGIIGVFRGLFHAHMGWLFTRETPDLARYVKDLRKSKMIRSVSALFPLWVVMGLTIPTLLGWLMVGGWQGALLGLIWGGLARIFLVHHVTWSINSVCHLWGHQPYKVKDHSKNNFIIAVLALGEGWHNNHHAFPTSARHGLRWWQFDFSFLVIRIMAFLHLVWKVKVPAKQLITVTDLQQ
jgi:stearoyl-CoA desaturase (delta-9 desaturase)